MDYLNEVIFPQLRRFADFELKLTRRGYYPKGQGSIDLIITPKFSKKNIKKAKPYSLIDQGTLVQVKGVSHCSKDLADARVAERQAQAAEEAIKSLGCPVQIRVECCDSISTGSGIILWAIFSKDEESDMVLHPIRIGADMLGEKRVSSEQVGKKAAESLLQEIKSGAPVDAHLCDNLIPFLAIVGGKIRTSAITDHTRANIYAVEQFFGKLYDIDEDTRVISVRNHVFLEN